MQTCLTCIKCLATPAKAATPTGMGWGVRRSGRWWAKNPVVTDIDKMHCSSVFNCTFLNKVCIAWHDNFKAWETTTPECSICLQSLAMLRGDICLERQFQAQKTVTSEY
eukprot:1161079-Pelagomonas_calceolata.AAC.12